MLFSTFGFIFIVAVIVVPIGALIHWTLKNKMKASLNISAGVAVVVALALGIYAFVIRTNVVVVNQDGIERFSMIGTADFEFENGSSESLPKLGYGEVIVNNTKETCIIKRFDYGDNLSDFEDELLSIALQVNPHSFFAFKGKKVEYYFEESPEILEFDQNASRSSMVKFELHFFKEEDWDIYYMYDGPVVGGIPNGTGTFWFSPSKYYVGDIVDGKFHGKGKMNFDEYEWYEGDYVEDKREGVGFYHYADGSTYEGDWVADSKQGQGIRTFSNGDVYIGGYFDGEMHGKGRYTFVDGDYYDGDFEEGYFQGYGEYYYVESDTYKEGRWYQDDYIGE